MEKITKKSIPNILTIIRMVFAIFAIVFVCLYNVSNSIFSLPLYSYSFFNDMAIIEIPVTYIIAGSIFLIASLTDLLDGYLARKNNWISDFGKLWDPIADKVLVNGVLISLAVNGSIPIFVPIIMICRDIVVDAMRMSASSKKIIVPANIWGKLKTVAQMIAILLTLFATGAADNFYKYQYVFYVINLFHLLACIFSITSGIIYLIKISKEIKKDNVKN